MTATTRGSSRTERAESIVQVLILLFVAGMAGAASFTHVHDWTMRNAPHGTGSWFGWANAVITELVPAAAGIEVRRRKRDRRPVTYPMAVLITAAAVSLAAQLSDATHTLGGALAFALPALAFLALTKLALSRANPKEEQTLMCGTCIDTECPWPEGHCPCPCHDENRHICPACGWPNAEPDGCACCINPDA